MGSSFWRVLRVRPTPGCYSNVQVLSGCVLRFGGFCGLLKRVYLCIFVWLQSFDKVTEHYLAGRVLTFVSDITNESSGSSVCKVFRLVIHCQHLCFSSGKMWQKSVWQNKLNSRSTYYHFSRALNLISPLNSSIFLSRFETTSLL